jgi:hypothetical protein
LRGNLFKNNNEEQGCGCSSAWWQKMPFENLLNISVKKDWVDYLSALLTPTVAIFGLYIGYRQWRTDEVKLRHELFDKQHRRFKAIRGKHHSSKSHVPPAEPVA